MVVRTALWCEREGGREGGREGSGEDVGGCMKCMMGVVMMVVRTALIEEGEGGREGGRGVVRMWMSSRALPFHSSLPPSLPPSLLTS